MVKDHKLSETRQEYWFLPLLLSAVLEVPDGTINQDKNEKIETKSQNYLHFHEL